MALHVKTCPVCKREFVASRSDAVYCSATCRQRRRRGTPPSAFLASNEGAPIPVTGRAPDEADVTDAVVMVKESVAILSAAAASGPDGYRPLCDRLSRAIGEVLEVEGL